ncbi:MAG TPA: hypothetical protein VK151_10135 [Fluviicola sp.]|nr:hypothetical protein [Fluviicola sp.]
MTAFLKRNKWTLVFGIIGMAGGYAYYHWVGCASGACPITSRPLPSILYGGLMGGLLGSAIQPSRKSS